MYTTLYEVRTRFVPSITGMDFRCVPSTLGVLYYGT